MNKIVDKVSNKLKYDKRVVDLVVRHSFRFLKEHMERSDSKSLMYRYFGKFVKKQRMKTVDEEKVPYNEQIIVKYIDNDKFKFSTFILKEDNWLYNLKDEKVTKLENVVKWRYLI